jgi:hypothetical protein
MINDNPEMKKMITSEEFVTTLMNASFEVTEDDFESPYCDVCGSCGESGCCNPEMCKSLQLNLSIKSVLADMNLDTEEFCVEYFIEQIQHRFKCGSYCDWNIKSYKELEKENEKLYKEVEALKGRLT